MSGWIKYIITFALAFGLMLMFRTLFFSIHGVIGNGLSPIYKSGDRLLINRCSYGIRIEGNRLLPYSRLMRQPVERGDIVAFTIPCDTVLGVCIARCKAVPGDTIKTKDGSLIIPGIVTCANADHYWLEAINNENPIDSRNIGLIPERNIIGKVLLVLYNRNNFFLP